MKALPSLSAWLRGLSRRERRFVVGGAAVVSLALVITLGLLPALDRWTTREAALAASLERHARLLSLTASEAPLRRTLAERRVGHAGTLGLLLAGATPALAASNLQTQLQQYAEESLVQLNRVDVAGTPKSAGSGLVSVPVVLQGQGDIYGLVDFLRRLQHGQRLLAIEELSVSTRSSYLDEDRLLSWSLRAHGLYPAKTSPADVIPAAVTSGAAASPNRPLNADSGRYAAIVAANPFSTDRVAPRTRFVPQGLRRDTVPVARAPRKPRETAPRLFGITRGPGGAVALIDADPAVPGAEVYEIGDAVRDGRVDAIGDSTVTLSRPSGRIVLRLPDTGERR